MAAMKRIEFNVDYGLNFNSKNVEKEIAKQLKEKEQFVKEYYEKNKKMPPIKMNIDNAVDIEGNPVDKKSLDAVVKKYEKAMNAALKTMTEDFRKNLGTDIAGALSESFSKEFENLFNNIENLIIDKFKDMYTNISSVISGINPVIINADDMVQVKDSKNKALSQSAENFKQDTLNAVTKIQDSVDEYEANVSEAGKSIEDTNNTLETSVTKTKGRKSKKRNEDGFLDDLDDITKSREKTLSQFENETIELKFQAKEIVKEIQSIDETLKSVRDEISVLEEEKKKIETGSNKSLNVKIGETTFTEDLISQIKQDEKETKKVLSNLYNNYKKTFEGIEKIENEYDEVDVLPANIDNELNTLKEKTSNITQVIQSIVKERDRFMKILSLSSDDDEYVVGDIFKLDIKDNIDDSVIEKDVKILDTKIKAKEAEIESLKARQNELKTEAKAIKKNIQNIEAKPKYQNSHIGAGDIQVAEEDGKQKVYAGVTIYPTVNINSFVNQVQRIVEACDEALKKRPVEVSVTPEMQSVGGLKADIEDVLKENPIQIALDKKNIADQIKSSIEGTQININGNLSGVTVSTNTNRISSEILTKSTGYIDAGSGDSYDEDDNFWDHLANNNIVSQDQLVNLVNLISNATTETNEDINEVNTNSLEFVDNLDKAIEKTEKIRENISQTANILVGEVKSVDDPRMEISKDKIEAYKLIDNLKKTIVRKSKEEKELFEKEHRTPEEAKRLSQLEYARKKRYREIEAEKKPVRDDWGKISQAIDKINNIQSEVDANERKLQELENLEKAEKEGKLSKSQKKRLGILENKTELNEREKKELNHLKTQDRLTDAEKETLKVLRQEKSENEKNLKTSKESFELAYKELDIIKQTSVYFGKMNNKALVEFSKEIGGKKTAKQLTTKALEEIERLKYQNIGSAQYAEAYDKSVKKITTKPKKGELSLLEQELDAYIKTDELWSSLNNDIKDKGKEETLLEIEKQIDFINKELSNIEIQKTNAKKKLDNGLYTKQKYDEVMSGLGTKSSGLYRQIDINKHKKGILNKYEQEQIEELAKANHEKRVIYEEDLKTQSGVIKRVNELRHKDIKSLKQYEELVIQQNARIAKRKSYNQQMEDYKKELLKKGMSEKEVENHKKDILKDTDYYQNEKAINKYNNQIQNVEYDLNEILNIMNDIEDLQSRLASSDMPIEVIKSTELELSNKRKNLETIIGRLGWESKEITQYKANQEYLSKLKKDSSVVEKKVDIDKFKEGATSTQDVVNNIVSELINTSNENKELKKSIDEIEKSLSKQKNQLSEFYQSKFKEISILKQEREKLLKEISLSNNEDEIKEKNVKIGIIDKQLKGLSKYSKLADNPAKLQADIDSAVEQLNQQSIQVINAKKSQILLNKSYIKNLNKELNIQKKIRKEQEPTEQELKQKNKILTAEKKTKNKNYNSQIDETKKEISDIEAEIKQLEDVAENSAQSIDEEIIELNKLLDELKSKLKDLNNIGIGQSMSNQTNTDSDLYQEYQKTVQPYYKEYSDSKQKIDIATSELKTVNKELDDLSIKYQDRIKNQEKVVDLTKKEIEIAKENIKTKESEGKKVSKKDLNHVNALEKRLIKEEKLSEELRTQFNLEAEIQRKSKLYKMSVIADSMQLPAMNKLINQGHKEAIKDYNSSLVTLQKLAKETGVSFGKVETRILESGEAIQVVKFNLDEINQELNVYDQGDQVKYNGLVDKKNKNENVLSSTTLPDAQIEKNIRTDYANKLYGVAQEELKAYNDELAKNGELTEEAEDHLLNLQRYMNEYGIVAGVKRNDLPSYFGLNEEILENMKWTWKDAKDAVLNTSDSIIAKKKEIVDTERQIAIIEEQIQSKESSKDNDKSKSDLSYKKQELAIKKQELKLLEEQKKKENERISLEQKFNREKIKEINNTNKEVSNVKSDNIEEQYKEPVINNQAAQEQVENQKDIQESISDITEEITEQEQAQKDLNSEIKEIEQQYSDKDIVLETNAIEDQIRAQERLNEAEKENLAIILEASKQQYADTKTVSVDDREALKEMGILTDENRESVNKLFLEFAQGLSTIEQVVDKMLQLRDIADNINVSNIPNGQVNVQNLDNLVAELSTYIKSNKVADIKANPEELLGKYDAYINAGGTQEGFAQISKSKSSLVPFVQNLRNAETQAHETATAVTEIAQANKDVATTATTPSAVEVQQEKAQEEIAKTDKMLQHQIAQAIQAAQISIAEGASVNIAGSVKIDEGQFGSLSEEFTDIQDVAYKLLEVVQDIYTVIEKNTNGVVQNIQSVQTPLSNVTAEAIEAGEAIEETQVKLSKFGNDFKVVSGGDIDLKGKEFEAIRDAVSAMDKAISSDKALRKIKDSGDITAKYISGFDAEGNEQAYVKLNSVFKDTEGKVVKLQHVYDVTNKTMIDSSNISVKMANNFELQEKAAKKADAQLTYYTSKLDKLKVKYQMFNIDDFGIDDEGNLFAKAGTKAEEIYDIITGKTKELIKNVILEMNKVDDKLNELKQQSRDGVLSTEQFDKLTSEYNLSIERFENSMNAVNRRINTQLEHSSRSWLSSWQGDLAGVEAYVNNIDTTGLNAQGLKYVEQLREALTDLNAEYVELHTQGEYFTQNQINNWKSQMQLINEIKKKINSNSAKSYINGKGFSLDEYSIDEKQFKMISQDSNYARAVLSALAQQIAQTDIEVVKLSEDNKTLTYTYKDIHKNTQTCKLSISDLGKTIRNTNVNSQKHVSLLSKVFGTLGDKLLQIMKYVSAYEIFYKVVNAVRSGVEIVKELDSAMTEMKKVTHDSEEALNRFAKSSHKIAQEIGSTASIIQNSAADWMRLGYSIEEAAGLAKNTSILMNVSEFEDIGSATEAMVAMIQAFKSEGKDVIELSEELIDKLNNIGNNYSISTSELAESLQRSSGTLIAANNSVDEAIALTTAGNAIIQDAETTGNALKVISMRIRGTSAKALEEEGEDTEGLIETTSKLEEKVKSLTAVNGKMGVSLLDANGNYRSTYAILQDIADVWEEIGKTDLADGQNRQAALLEVLAGKTRAQSLASILQNADMLRDAYEDVQNSEGSAARENEAYMESIEAHLQVLTAKWQELWDNTLNSKTINFVIDRVSDLVGLIDKVGLGWSALFTGGAVFGLYKFLNKDKSGGRAKVCVYIRSQSSSNMPPNKLAER